MAPPRVVRGPGGPLLGGGYGSTKGGPLLGGGYGSTKGC